MVAVLRAFSGALLRATALHDLKAETIRLRTEYARRLAALRRGGDDAVELISGPMPMTPTTTAQPRAA